MAFGIENTNTVRATGCDCQRWIIMTSRGIDKKAEISHKTA
jgi:hypothetical protein